MPASLRPLTLAATLLLVGCVGGRGWNPFAEVSPPALTPESSCEQVVAHLNQNISRCTGWRSSDVTVALDGMPLRASAMMAVESPRRFRMQVSSIMGDLADFGSNDERMWFWQRPQPDQQQWIYTCAHQDLPAAQDNLPIPFRPDWLMEVLGVIPIDASQFTMEAHPTEAGQFLLTSMQTAPDGSQVKRVMTVDAKRGVVVGHAMWAVDDTTGRLIAQAKLADHRRDETTGVTLPRRIVVSYPATNAVMTLTIKDVEVNPTAVTAKMWQPTVAADCPYRDLATGKVVTLDQVGTF